MIYNNVQRRTIELRTIIKTVVKRGEHIKGVVKVSSFLRLHRQQQESQAQSLREEFNKALSHLNASYRQLDFCDREYIDSIVFTIGAAEHRLVAVLQVARKEGVKAW